MKKIFLALACLLSLQAMAKDNSPYIYKVYDFRPAPGQFTNTLPEYEAGNTQADMNAKCEEYLAGQAKGSMVCLGAYGGYIIFGFDHNVANKPGDYDFKIYGNAFKEPGLANAGSAEPGIVMVSYDSNHNNQPDDQWYELAGSDYYKASTLHSYEITYYKPRGNEPDDTYIRWSSNDSAEPSGYVKRNTFHRQSYWPEWIDGNEIKFSGSRLAKNAYMENNTWLQRMLAWGYVDNRPNTEDPGFKIDWAVDANGNPVQLNQISFVKVYTGVNQYCGDLGETSTEIIGAEDLHPTSAGVEGITDEHHIALLGSGNGLLQLDNGTETAVSGILYDLQGRSAMQILIEPGYQSIDVSSVAPGLYVLRAGSATFKIKL